MLKKAPMKFDKELFKGTVLNNIKTLYFTAERWKKLPNSRFFRHYPMRLRTLL